MLSLRAVFHRAISSEIACAEMAKADLSGKDGFCKSTVIKQGERRRWERRIETRDENERRRRGKTARGAA